MNLNFNSKTKELSGILPDLDKEKIEQYFELIIDDIYLVDIFIYYYYEQKIGTITEIGEVEIINFCNIKDIDYSIHIEMWYSNEEIDFIRSNVNEIINILKSNYNE